MARRKVAGERVLGPYRGRNGYRIVRLHPERKPASLSFGTEAEALKAKRDIENALGRTARTLEETIEDYKKYLADDKGNKSLSIDQTARKLRRFFPDHTLPVSLLTPARCAGYYEALRTAKKRNGKPLSVDYHRNALAEARTFLKWCMVEKKWLRSNPLDGVQGKGKRKHGKPQLRIDEVRRWLDKATGIADAALADPQQKNRVAGAVAAMVTFLLGLRATETVSRVVRDLDDRGRRLWIPDSKTEAGKRTIKVPDVLRPYLLKLAEGKKPDERLFGHNTRHWVRKWVQRICKAAKVPTVCAHSMRGLHSTLAVAAGVTPDVVAASVGHESSTTTLQSYAKPEAVATAQQERVLRVLDGGGQPSDEGSPDLLAELLDRHTPEEILAALAARGKERGKKGRSKLEVVP